MAKLYWRVKIDGKWTWRPCEAYERAGDFVWVRKLQTCLQEEEE